MTTNPTKRLSTPGDGSSAPASPDAPGLLETARGHRIAGRMSEAIEGFAGAIEQAKAEGNSVALVEACRCLGIMHHLRGEPLAAQAFCGEALTHARGLGKATLIAEVLNALAGFDLERGATEVARERYLEALQLGQADPALVARVEQNLGIIATIQGDLDTAMKHYRQSLQAFENANDTHGCAIVHHNLGMLCADRLDWLGAERHYQQCLVLATTTGDLHLQGLCLLSRTEIHLAHGRYEAAREHGEAALSIFERLDARLEQPDIYKVLGIVFRETKRPTLAESRFRSAIEIAASTGSPLSEAEATRELARLYQMTDRSGEALHLFDRAHELFVRLGAQTDIGEVLQLRERLAAA